MLLSSLFFFFLPSSMVPLFLRVYGSSFFAVSFPGNDKNDKMRLDSEYFCYSLSYSHLCLPPRFLFVLFFYAPVSLCLPPSVSTILFLSNDDKDKLQREIYTTLSSFVTFISPVPLFFFLILCAFVFNASCVSLCLLSLSRLFSSLQPLLFLYLVLTS